MSSSIRIRVRRSLAAAAVATALLTVGSTAALASFGDGGSVGGNSFSTRVLQPPSGLQTTVSCTGGTAGAVPSFVANSQTTGYNGPVTVVRPPGTQAGDVLIAQIASDSTNSVDAPGWTLIRQDKDTSDGFWQAVLYRVAGASEPASYTLTPSQTGPEEIVFGVNTYRGVDTANPINAQGGQVTSAFISTVTAPSITTTLANTRLVTFWGRDGNEFLNAPGSMTQRWALNGASLPEDIAGTSADESRSTAGATGTRVATAGGTNNGIGQSVALAPLSSSASVNVIASWSPTPSGFASGYHLQRWNGAGLEADLNVNGAGTTTAGDPGLVPGATYEYRLFAVYENWTSTVVTGNVTTTCGSPPPSGAMVVFRRNGVQTPLSSSWDGTSLATGIATQPMGEWRIIQAAASRTRDEVIATGVNTDAKINAEMRIDGTWVEPFGASLGAPSETFWWGTDVAYESTSGDAVLVWNNGSSGTEGVSYRVWDGSNWSGEATITTPLAGEPKQMHLAASPIDDEMILVASNAASQDYAMVWDGAQWVDGQAVVLDSGSGNDRTDVNVAYEAQSGRAMVVYAQGAGAPGENLRYRRWDGSWSAQGSLSPPGASGVPRWTMLASDPTSNRLALGVLTFDSNIWLATWSGAAWTDDTAVSSSASSEIAPTVAVAFEGLSGQALATYAEAGATAIRYRTWSAGSGWGAESEGPTMATVPNSMTLDARPSTDEIVLVAQGVGGLSLARWSGLAWSAVAPIATDTGEVKNQPFAWVWR